MVDGREWQMGKSGRWQRAVDGREWYMAETGRWERAVDGSVVDDRLW